MVEGPGLTALGFICMTISGIFLSTQQGVNLTLGRNVGKSFAAVVSFSTGLVALLLFFMVDVVAMGQAPPTKAGAQAAPWWSWIGGPLGAFYVASIIVFAPILGAGNATSVFVAAQIITSVVLDSQGWVGFPKKTFQWQRVIGVLLLVGGVIIITQFDGAVEAPPAVPPSPAPLLDTTSSGPLPPPLALGGRRAALLGAAAGGGGVSAVHSQVPLIGLTSSSAVVLEPAPSDSSTSDGKLGAHFHLPAGTAPAGQVAADVDVDHKQQESF